MNAMILAAGRGTRLRSLGLDIPKVLVEVGGEPLLTRQLRYLEREGVQRVVINAHHLSDAIEEFAQAYQGPLELTVVVEPELLGTAGGVRNALDHLGDGPFLVLYGDVLIDARLGPLVRRHRERGAAATLAVYESFDVEGKGTVTAGEDGRVIGFVEKAAEAGSSEAALVNAGLYVLEPGVVAAIPTGVECDFGTDLFPSVLAQGAHLQIFRLPAPVIDIGTPEGLDRARAQRP
jgi:NDP-sugar pyrophosphorylase family protein